MLLAKSYLQARGLSAATLAIPVQLIVAGREAYSKYNADLVEVSRKRKAEEIERQVENEKQKILVGAASDAKRLKQMSEIDLQEQSVSISYLTFA